MLDALESFQQNCRSQWTGTRDKERGIEPYSLTFDNSRKRELITINLAYTENKVDIILNKYYK